MAWYATFGLVIRFQLTVGLFPQVFLLMMTSPQLGAWEIVEAGDIDLAKLRLVLPRVDLPQAWVRTGPWWFRLLWARRVVAVTNPRGIYVRPDVMNRMILGLEPDRNARLIVHELTHLEQWHRIGLVRYLFQYVADYVWGLFRGRGLNGSYMDIRFEVEARDTVSLVAPLSRPQ